jgi:serine/threonine-protein kinase
VARFSFVLPDGQQFSGNARRLAVSPDGATIVYVANGQLYRRPLDSPDIEAIAGTSENPALPDVSPDGRSIAYVAVDAPSQSLVIKRVPIAGGTALKVHDAGERTTPGGWTPLDASLAWSGDQILWTSPSGIMAGPAGGGTPKRLVSLDPAVEVATSARLINGGEHVLFTVRRIGVGGPEAYTLVAQSVTGRDRKVLMSAGRNGFALPSGHLVYLRGTELMAVPFDERRVEVSGDPMVLAANMTPHLAISAAGTIVYQPAVATGLRTLVWVDRRGMEEPMNLPPQTGTTLRLSPDNTRLAVASGTEIKVWNLGKATMTRLSEGGSGHWDVAWTPDGRDLLFSAGRTPTTIQILRKPADGSGAATVVTPMPGGYPNAISPDGRTLVFHRGVGELMFQTLSPLSEATPLVKGPTLNGVLSPDGRWVAYQSSETGPPEVFVRAFPDAGAGQWQVSSGGGRYPIWSRDGRELFYVNTAGRLIALPVETHSGLETGAPVALFQADFYVRGSNSRPFDVSRDGQRFVFAKTPTGDRPTVEVVTNWFTEVAAIVSGRSDSAP